MNDTDLISRLLDEHNPQEHSTLDFLVCSCGDHDDFQNRSFNDHVALSLVNAGVRVMPPSIREASEKHGIPLVYHDLPIDIVHPAPFEGDYESEPARGIRHGPWCKPDSQNMERLERSDLPSIDTQDPERLDGWNLRWLKENKTTPIHPSYLDTMMEPKKSPY